MREKTEQNGLVYQDNRIAYDALGRMRDVSDSRVHISIDYDAVGNRTHIKSHVLGSADKSLDKESWYAYDEMNRQILVDGAKNGDVNDLTNISVKQGHIARGGSGAPVAAGQFCPCRASSARP